MKRTHIQMTVIGPSFINVKNPSAHSQSISIYRDYSFIEFGEKPVNQGGNRLSAEHYQR